MQAFEVVRDRAKQRGITTSELARRIGVHSELLRRSLLGERTIKADELISLSKELDLQLSDFTNN